MTVTLLSALVINNTDSDSLVSVALKLLLKKDIQEFSGKAAIKAGVENMMFGIHI